MSFPARRVAPAASKRSALLAQVPASHTVLQTAEGIGGSAGCGGLSSSTAKLHSCAPLSSGAGKPTNAHCSYSRVCSHQSHGRDVFKPGCCRVVGRGTKMSTSSLSVPLHPSWSTGSGRALNVTSLWLCRKEPGLAAAQLCAPTAAPLDANLTLGRVGKESGLLPEQCPHEFVGTLSMTGFITLWGFFWCLVAISLWCVGV